MKHKQQLREEAIVRQREYALLPIEVKIELCRASRGNSKRQLTKLLAKLEAK